MAMCDCKPRPVPPAVAAFTLEECQRLLDRIAELETALRLNAHCLGKCLTGGEVSAARAGLALLLAGELLGEAGL